MYHSFLCSDALLHVGHVDVIRPIKVYVFMQTVLHMFNVSFGAIIRNESNICALTKTIILIVFFLGGGW